MKNRIKQLEKLRENIAALRYRETVEGTCDDKCGERLENKILDLVNDARLIGELYKDERQFCKKCKAPLGENVDGKPLCSCEL